MRLFQVIVVGGRADVCRICPGEQSFVGELTVLIVYMPIRKVVAASDSTYWRGVESSVIPRAAGLGADTDFP